MEDEASAQGNRAYTQGAGIDAHDEEGSTIQVGKEVSTLKVV